MGRSRPPLGPLPTPFTIVIDTREQCPIDFLDLYSDAKDGNKLLKVRTVLRTLRSGDYSVLGCEDQIAVERKSLSDLYGTLGQARDRFEREFVRLNQLTFAAIVVEAELSSVLDGARYSRLNPKTVYRTVIAWQQRYPRVHWWFVDGRRMGEVTTFRILERWWRDHNANADHAGKAVVSGGDWVRG